MLPPWNLCGGVPHTLCVKPKVMNPTAAISKRMMLMSPIFSRQARCGEGVVSERFFERVFKEGVRYQKTRCDLGGKGVDVCTGT
jgi:hypothetical protein